MSGEPIEEPDLTSLHDEYDVLHELGRGATGIVYLGRDRELDRHVAIKVLRKHLVHEGDATARFAREVRTVARLTHPNIVSIYSVRRLPDGNLAVIMQYLRGRTLKATLRTDGALAPERAVAVLRDIGVALGFAHRHGVIHRDVKPDNILLSEETGHAYLFDFGIARSSPDARLTLTGTALGTPHYMSPEQIDDGELDGRSDLYSLGLVGWEMLAGRRPWGGESLYSVIYKQKSEQPADLRKVRPDVPARLHSAIEAALHKNSGDRPGDADDFLRLLSDSGTPDRWRRLRRWRAATTGRWSWPATASPADVPEPPIEEARTIRYRRPTVVPIPPPVHATRWPASAPLRRAAAVVLAVLLGASAVLAALQIRGSEPTDGSLALTQPTAASASAIFAGGMHTCSLSSSGRASCWGGNDHGQLGEGSTASRSKPAALDASFRFRNLSVGVTHTCGITSDEHAYCWGGNGSGQLGDGAVAPRTAPAPVRSSLRFVEVRPGMAHTCGRTPDGEVHCWGDNSLGQLGDGSLEASLTPAPVAAAGPFRELAASWNHSCALNDNGAAACWGHNTFGQLGDGTSSNRSLPVDVPDHTFRTIAVGGAHTCALDEGGAAFCWGRNSDGRLGDGSTSDRLRPERVSTNERFTQITTGSAHVCALAEDGVAFCWGRNDLGQLGDGGTTDRRLPVPVRGGHTFASIHASGAAHTCGTTVRGENYCWGYNAVGQLGDGTRGVRTQPIRVGGPVFRAAARDDVDSRS